MAKMILMTGRCGAGKTEFVQKFLKEHPAYDVFCPDDYYAEYNGDERDRSNAFLVWMTMYVGINAAMRDGRDIIIDTNSPTETMREQFIDWFPNFDEYELIYILTPYAICSKNNSTRYRKIPQERFDELFSNYKSPFDDRSLKRWDSILVYMNDGKNFKLKESIKPKLI